MKRLFLAIGIFLCGTPVWGAHGYSQFGELKYRAGFDHFESVLTQRQLNHFPEPLFIINDEDFFHLFNTQTFSLPKIHNW